MEVDELIRILSLQPHIEGGYFRENYRSRQSVLGNALPESYSGERALGTAIYYLLIPGTFSALHQLKGDEVYHFYLGDPVEMLLLSPEGEIKEPVLGNQLAEGQHLQMLVPGLWWQGSKLRAGGRFALMGCTMAPGFDYQDFREGERQELAAAYPQAADGIALLTRK
jgi:predicted cupin superfamily sugar epimerase